MRATRGGCTAAVATKGVAGRGGGCTVAHAQSHRDAGSVLPTVCMMWPRGFSSMLSTCPRQRSGDS